MCLIAYVPAGKSLPLENMKAAHFANDDGIGIMSRNGIYKFLGRKALKKAIKTVALLEADKIEYAIHFRYKTHGDIILQNCHPFETPNKRAYVMHNGVLGQYTAKATKLMSDTAAFVAEYLKDVPDDNNMDYWSEVARHVGWGNKLCIMTHDFKFILVHGEAGTYRDGIWYSQTYSLPHIPVVYGGSAYPTRDYHTPIERSNVWPYHVLDCTCTTCMTEVQRRNHNAAKTGENADYWTNSDSWYKRAKEREDRAAARENVSEALQRALDRRGYPYGGGIRDPRVSGGSRLASKPLQLTHNPDAAGMTRTAIQALAADTLGTTCEVIPVDETQRKDEDNQLDAALREHLMRIDDDGGYAEVELDVSTRGDCQLPGWSETGTDS
jgi:hypothetical protein